MNGRHRIARAFSLIELVIVVTIIGMVSSMAIPRLSRGATGASDAALNGDLRHLRNAILFYAIEHNNTFPGPTAEDVTSQLTTFSDLSGACSATPTAKCRFGPYLAGIPPAPVGANLGSTGILIDTDNSPPKPQPAKPAGWVYNPNTGEIYPNDGAASLKVGGSDAIVVDLGEGAIAVGGLGID